MNVLTLARCHTSLSVADDGSLPTEFLLFRAGVNDTTKGPCVFDAQSAAAVMAEAEAWGNDYMLDLEHDSLSEAARAHRSDAANAMGWFRIEVREGALWAVNVRYTPEGVARLTNKTQRYISPAFVRDDEGRVSQIVNAALCSMPAIHDATALVAASKVTTPALHVDLSLLAVACVLTAHTLGRKTNGSRSPEKGPRGDRKR